MAVQQLRVNAPSNVSLTDGNTYDAIAGKSAEQLIAELHGKYYTQTYRQKLWHASITTATAIPIFATNMTPNFAIVNPPGNNTYIVLARINVGFVAGTSVASTIGYAYLPGINPGMVGTLNTVSTFTAGPAIQPGIVGQKYGGNALFLSSMTVGGAVNQWTVHKWSNMSAGVVTATSTAAAFSMWEDFDGMVVIPPGVGWAPMSQPALVTTMQISVSAYEVPFP